MGPWERAEREIQRGCGGVEAPHEAEVAGGCPRGEGVDGVQDDVHHVGVVVDAFHDADRLDRAGAARGREVHDGHEHVEGGAVDANVDPQAGGGGGVRAGRRRAAAAAHAAAAAAAATAAAASGAAGEARGRRAGVVAVGLLEQAHAVADRPHPPPRRAAHPHRASTKNRGRTHARVWVGNTRR